MKRISHPAWLPLSQRRRWEKMYDSKIDFKGDVRHTFSNKWKASDSFLLFLQWNKKFCGDVTSPCGLKLIGPQLFKEIVKDMENTQTGSKKKLLAYSSIKSTSYHSMFPHWVQMLKFNTAGLFALPTVRCIHCMPRIVDNTIRHLVI